MSIGDGRRGAADDQVGRVKSGKVVVGQGDAGVNLDWRLRADAPDTVGRMNAPAVDPSLLAFSVALADRAGRLASERFFAADFELAAKHDGSDVTDADTAVEELIRSELRLHFPGDEVLGEEAGVTAGSSGRRWIIDPIDGTTYFAHRIPLLRTSSPMKTSMGRPSASSTSLSPAG